MSRPTTATTRTSCRAEPAAPWTIAESDQAPVPVKRSYAPRSTPQATAPKTPNLVSVFARDQAAWAPNIRFTPLATLRCSHLGLNLLLEIRRPPCAMLDRKSTRL